MPANNININNITNTENIEPAIAHGDLDAVRAILDADPAALEQRFHDNCGFSPLMWACRRRQEAIVEELLRRGADVNARNRGEANGEGGNFALWFAANGSASGGASIAKRLVERGADVNMAGEFGQTALHQAAAWNNTKTAALLLHSGADMNARTAEGDTPLALARKSGFVEVAQILKQESEERYRICNERVMDGA